LRKALHFVTWGSGEVPAYTRYYIEQLAPWVDEVWVSTNEGRPVDVEWFSSRGFHLNFVPNKSRDFEKHYYWMMAQGREKICSYEHIILANDCLVCFGPLTRLMQWVNSRREDLLGLNSSSFPLYHIQSYFLVMRQPMLAKVWDHFRSVGVVPPIQEVIQYEEKLQQLASSLTPMFAMKHRRGWDELFFTPFDAGVPLVKHQCIMPRKPYHLQKWQTRILRGGHPAAKAWSHLPLVADPAYKPRHS